MTTPTPTRAVRPTAKPARAVRDSGKPAAKPAAGSRRGDIRALEPARPAIDIDIDIFREGGSLAGFRQQLRAASLAQRIGLERSGVPHYVVRALGQGIGSSASEVQQLLRIPPATFKKKIAAQEAFSGAVGQSVIEVMDLINQVEQMLEPVAAKSRRFDAQKWVGEWIRRPQPALGGAKPADMLDTPSGREQVRRLLGAVASGAYL